jgi:ParB family chromosome partitioning protein
MAFQGDSIYWVEVEKVVPNPFQPRREFDQSKLQELADSIRMYGVLQPLTVTRNEVQREDGTFYTEYELIAGERRLRASKLAGTAQVPVIIREGEQSEQEKLELAIIENLQREDLNAVDRALAFKQLAEMFGLSHSQVAQKVGRSREYVSNSIRLLGLPEKILESLKQGNMSEGHARTLLMLNDRPEEQDVIYREILLKKMSVREVERIIRKIATDKVRKKSAGDLDSNLIEYEKQFTETLGTRVQIQKTDFGGKLTIDYFSVEDLEGMLERMKREAADLAPEQDAVDTLAEHTPLQHVREAQEHSDSVATESNPEPVPAASPDVIPPTGTYTREEQPVTEPVPIPASQPVPNVPQPAPAASAPVYQSPEPIPETQSEPVIPEQPTPTQSEAPAPEPVSASAPQQPEPKPAPETPAHGHHQPFAPRYAPQSFQSNQSVNPQPVAPTTPSATPEPSSQPAAPATEEQSQSAEAQPDAPKPAEDESSLYSIRNFNI